MSTFLNTLTNRMAFFFTPNRQEEFEQRTLNRKNELEYNQRLVQKILDTTPGYLALLDMSSRRYLYANAHTAELFGFTQAAFKHLDQAVVERAIYPEDLPVYFKLLALLRSGHENQVYEAEFRVRNPRGELRWIEQRGVIFQEGAQGRSRQVLLTGDDVTERREARDQLHYMSTHDGLTGLHNWAYFQEALDQVQREGKFPATIIMMDVDNLKVINDTLGHAAGDETLREVGARLGNAFRSDDVIARVGGDEFAALLPRVNEATAKEIIRRVRDRFQGSTTPSGIRLDVLSIGLCTAYNASELVEARRRADRRMYLDKQKRKTAA